MKELSFDLFPPCNGSVQGLYVDQTFSPDSLQGVAGCLANAEAHHRLPCGFVIPHMELIFVSVVLRHRLQEERNHYEAVYKRMKLIDRLKGGCRGVGR